MCKIFNKWCLTSFLLIGFCNFAKTAWLRCYYGRSLEDYLQTSLDNPMPIVNSTCYNPELVTLVYTFGYTGRPSGPATTAVLTTYIAAKKKNVILLDWEEEARSGMLGMHLGYAFFAAPNAKKVGEDLGDALSRLARGGMNMSEVHLMGHSLGAHLMAYAGRRARKLGQVVSRITGLDPARALFEGTLTLYNGLDRTCAKFVDIIHSNPGHYGTSESRGTVDLWPNYNHTGMQPGCPTGTFDIFSPADLCSHDRSWRYLIESVRSATAFQASAADDYDSWVECNGVSHSTIYLGDLMNTRARGNYYLCTRPRAPFGMGAEGLAPDDNQIRARRSSAPAVFNLWHLFR